MSWWFNQSSYRNYVQVLLSTSALSHPDPPASDIPAQIQPCTQNKSVNSHLIIEAKPVLTVWFRFLLLETLSILSVLFLLTSVGCSSTYLISLSLPQKSQPHLSSHSACSNKSHWNGPKFPAIDPKSTIWNSLQHFSSTRLQSLKVFLEFRSVRVPWSTSVCAHFSVWESLGWFWSQSGGSYLWGLLSQS